MRLRWLWWLAGQLRLRVFDDFNRLALVLGGRKPTEGQVICPVEAPVVFWMFHSLRPILLILQVLSDSLPCVCILSDWI